MHFLTRAIIPGLVLALSSCATCDPNRNTKRGVLIGTLTGAFGGAFLLDNALVLALGEGTAGFYAGRSMDRDRMEEGPCNGPSEAIVEKADEEEIDHVSPSITALTASTIENLDAEFAASDESPIEIPKTVLQKPEVKASEAAEIIIDTVYSRGYKVGSSAVPDGLASMLKSVVNVLKTLPDTRLYLTGHADSTGDARFNHFLSIRRASNAAILVAEQGVEESRIEIMGYGEEQPIANNSTEDGRSQNRRVEIKIRRTNEDGLSIRVKGT